MQRNINEIIIFLVNLLKIRRRNKKINLINPFKTTEHVLGLIIKSPKFRNENCTQDEYNAFQINYN